MKLTSFVTALLFATISSAHTDFIKDGNRAELFEIMDNEVPDFRITVSAEEFAELKNQIGAGGGFFKRQWDGGNMGGFGGGNMGGFGGGFGGGMGGGFVGFGQKENYKVKNATLIVDINGQQKSFDNINFGIGGSSSRSYARQAFNLKIKGKETLFGRKQFRIRSDAREATYLRSKLACDIHNRLGMPSISANYISLYVNDEYWGFYVLMDSPKPSWAEIEYGDVDTTHIMKCKNGGNVLTVSSSATQCMNENDEATDNTEWTNLLSRIDSATSASDIEDIFDVDQFLREMAYEYLSGSWDHFLNSAHNFIMYKMPEQYGGKWTMVEYDFDADFGQDVCAIEFMGSVKDDKDYPSWSFLDWANKPRHIVDILINNDDTRFKNIVWEMIEKAFNPELLFDRIDELKDFIRPYVQKDKTPVNGKKPGMLNTRATNDYTMEQWEANSEFTNLGINSSSSGYGLKYWILNRYRKACELYNFNCDPVYMDLNYYYDIDRNVEGPINTQFNIGFGFGGAQQQQPTQPKTTQSQPPKPANYTSTKKTITATVTQIASTSNANCWSEKLGFPCCSTCSEVVYTDADGKWGIENGNWCGLTC